MNIAHHVESYRFWNVVTLWARETLQHELILARALAKGVVRDGLRMQSVDAKWATRGTFELHGAPFVGYVARDGVLPVFIRSSALKHLLDIVENAATPNSAAVHDEFVTKQDFRVWLEQENMSLPAFWFASTEQA